MIRTKIKVRIMQILAQSRLGDCHFNLECSTEDEPGDVFDLKFSLDPDYYYKLTRKQAAQEDQFETAMVPSQVLIIPANKDGLDFEGCFAQLEAWVKDIEKEFYDAAEYRQSNFFRDEFVKFFIAKYGQSDERFDLQELADLEAKLRQFEKDVNPVYSREVKPGPGVKTLNELITEVLIDANVYTKEQWVRVGGAKLYYLTKLIYKNITTSLADMEGAKKLLLPLVS